MIKLIKVLFKKIFFKMHGPKSKFIMKVVQVRKTRRVLKRSEKIFEIKEDGRR